MNESNKPQVTELYIEELSEVTGGLRFKPSITTFAIGEEGGHVIPSIALREDGPIATTFAVGEEGGGKLF